MAAPTRRELAADLDRALRGPTPADALRPLIALIRSAPHDFDARLVTGDVLSALGRAPQAALVYAASLRQCALMGHPLKALVALKRLSALDPAARQLAHAFAARYATGSPALGRAVRLAPPDPESAVPENAWPPPSLDAAQTADAATQVACSDEALPHAPPTVAPIPLLSELPPDALARVLDAVTLLRVAPGEVVMREGEPGDAFYMIARGKLLVTRKGQRLASLEAGSVVGEMALLSAAPRGATVTATEPADLLVFGREALAAASRELAVLAAALERFMRQRLVDHLLATHPFFKPFDPAQRVQLAARFEPRSFTAGATLIREGEPGEGLWMLLTGGAAVTREGVDIATLGPGELFGEIALLDATPTTATVTATANGTALVLARELFERLVAGVPQLRRYLEDLADERRMDLRLSLVPGEDLLL
ncbi:MAG: cyclic nucleotide-binding domain-containing protein [Polyangiales bacterium]